MTAGVRRNDPEFFFFEGQNSSRYIEKTSTDLGPRRRSRRLKGQNSDFLHIRQARSACRRRAAPAAGAQRLLRAPQARALRAERRRREDVRSPAGVNSKKKEKAAGAQRLLRAPKALASRPFTIYTYIYMLNGRLERLRRSHSRLRRSETPTGD